MRIVAADYLFTPSAVDANALALDEDNILLAIGEKSELIKEFPSAQKEEHQGVLLPGLVNAHCHLELSAFGTSRKPSKGEPFTSWIEELLAKRQESIFTPEQLFSAAAEMAVEQFQSGVVLLGDTGNQEAPENWLRSSSFKVPEIIRMIELLAPSANASEQAKKRLQKSSYNDHFTAHAPYSVPAEILKRIKEDCRKKDLVFSIHTAETAGEKEFLLSRSGIFRDFLEKRGAWDGAFLTQKSYPGAVQMFERLDLLDEKTLLVHCTNLLDGDLAIIAENKSKLCLCPGSNEFLGVGRAAVEEFVEAGIEICIGSDSITSNPVPDIWQEMALLSRNCKNLQPKTILRAATLGGARAFGKEFEYGCFVESQRAHAILVNSPKLISSNSISEVERVLVSGGRPTVVTHI